MVWAMGSHGYCGQVFRCQCDLGLRPGSNSATLAVSFHLSEPHSLFGLAVKTTV